MDVLISEMGNTVRQADDFVNYTKDFLLHQEMKFGTFEFINHHIISLDRVNFNIVLDRLFFQDTDEKFYVLNFSDGVLEVQIGEDTFRNFLVRNTYKPLVVLYEDDNIAFLKGHYVLVTSTNSEYRTIFNATNKRNAKIEILYYVNYDNFLKEIILNKKEILNLFVSQVVKDDLKKFVKENDWSYTNKTTFSRYLQIFLFDGYF